MSNTRRAIIAPGRHETTSSSFDAFYKREYHGMVAIARAMVPDRAQAEDLVQEAFISAHRNWARVGRYDSPRLWVRRVLLNRATSLRRTLGSEMRAITRLGSQPGQGITADVSQSTAEVWDEVRKLPKRQRQVVVLHYVSGMTMDQIGLTLQCAPGTVKAHLHRARQQLKQTLSTWEGE